MITVGVAGAAGKMGRALLRAVNEHPQLSLGSAWESSQHPAVGQDAGLLAGDAANGVLVGDSAASGLALCQVAIDFTVPVATMALLALAVTQRKALVIGTTGLSPEQTAQLTAAGKTLPLVYATNYSTGVNVLWALAQQAARSLGETFDAEIIETHHNQKKDAPSGTALTLLDAICRGKGLDPAQAGRFQREGLIGPRAPHEVGVSAVRAGDVVGDHIALFAGPGERLELKHQAHTRDTFARGAARAAAWVMGQKPGVHSMTEVLGLPRT